MADEFITPMGEATAQLHEVYTSLRAGGFTESEACRIVAYIMTSANTEDTE